MDELIIAKLNKKYFYSDIDTDHEIKAMTPYACSNSGIICKMDNIIVDVFKQLLNINPGIDVCVSTISTKRIFLLNSEVVHVSYEYYRNNEAEQIRRISEGRFNIQPIPISSTINFQLVDFEDDDKIFEINGDNIITFIFNTIDEGCGQDINYHILYSILNICNENIIDRVQEFTTIEKVQNLNIGDKLYLCKIDYRNGKTNANMYTGEVTGFETVDKQIFKPIITSKQLNFSHGIIEENPYYEKTQGSVVEVKYCNEDASGTAIVCLSEEECKYYMWLFGNK